MHFSKRNKISLQIRELGIINLVVSLALALVGSIWAIYFESVVHNPSKVGLINSIFGIVGILSFIIFIPLIEKSSKTRIFAISILFYGVSYFLFSFIKGFYLIIFLGIFIHVVASLRMNVAGIILRDKSKRDSVSKNNGLMYVLFNLSWLVGPIIAGFLAQKFGFGLVFIVSGCLMILALFLLNFFKFKDSRKEKNVDGNLFRLVKEFFSKKKFVLNYIISGGISFWWAFVYIYIPIYIVESGKGGLVVGVFLSAIVVPLILLEYPFAKMAGKAGFRKMFFRGYLITLIISVLCFFVSGFYAILALIVLGSIGVAMLEPTTEAYFFDITTKKQRDKFYGIYNTTIDVNYTLSLFLIAFVIKFLPFKYSFLVLGIFMGIYCLLSLKVKNIIESKRKGF